MTDSEFEWLLTHAGVTQEYFRFAHLRRWSDQNIRLWEKSQQVHGFFTLGNHEHKHYDMETDCIYKDMKFMHICK